MATIQVLSHITLNLLRPNSNVVVYAKQYDKASRAIDIDLVAGTELWDVPQEIESVVLYTKPDGKNGMYDVIEDGETFAVEKIGTGKIRLTLAEQALTVAGNVFVQICFFSEKERLSTLSFVVHVEKGTPPDSSVESSDYFSVLSELIEGLLGVEAHCPIIDPTTRNWMLWSKEHGRYEDSGLTSVGPTGPAPIVTSVQTMYAVSSSGTIVPTDGWTSEHIEAPAGSYLWAKNTIVYDNGTEAVITLPSYMGNDGEGAPGSRTPLDLGVASAGTANAYSREDHVHRLPTAQEIGAISAVDFFLQIYPIGCTYESSDPTSPAELFGGYWTPIEGRFTIGASSTYPAGSTGGSAAVTLTENQIPAHTHGRISLTGYVPTRSLTNKTSNIFGTSSGIVSTPRSSAEFTGGISFSGIDSTKGWDITVDASHEHSSVGGGQSHNNMPPYVAYYKWERVAPPE